MKISLWLQLISIVAALVFQFVLHGAEGLWQLLAAAVFGGIYWLVRKLSGGKFGMGDVWFGVFQGCCLELVALPLCLAVEAVIGAVVFGVMALLKGGRAPRPIPFVPVMALGLEVSYGLFYIAF